jgi:hypothetical protein
MTDAAGRPCKTLPEIPGWRGESVFVCMRARLPVCACACEFSTDNCGFRLRSWFEKKLAGFKQGYQCMGPSVSI